MTEIVKFLCANYKGINLIYGIRFGKFEWHYFDQKDSLASEHNLLPDRVHRMIGTFDKPRTIEVPLIPEQLKRYFNDGKLMFKNKELTTRLPLVDKNLGQPEKPEDKSKRKTTEHLVFICGQTNPVLFLKEFEKCSDLKNDKDKMFKLRNFVNESDRVEFSEMYFVSDWSTMRQTFIKKYSLIFTENKRKELSIIFGAEVSVRSFVERKLLALSVYTTLPFVNQMEMVLNELPCEISNLFLINEMMTEPKTKILEFCDSILDLASTMREKSEQQPQIVHNSMNQMELFHFDPDQESSDQQSISSSQSTSRGRGRSGRGRGGRGRGGRGHDLTGDSSYSQSTDQNELVDSSPQNRTKTKPGRRGGRVVKRGRQTTPKKLKTIDENHFSDNMDTN